MNKKGRITLLGNFDGVHIGHRALIDVGLSLAEKSGCSLVAWTFDSVFAPSIMTTEERISTLKSCGVDEVILESFDKVKDYSPERFVAEVLKDILKTCHCVCGYNYTFGRGGKGTPELLSKLCGENGIEVTVIGKVEKNGSEVSSSAIRSFLKDGNVEGAYELMERRYYCVGEVKRGAGNGKKMGMPTMNFYFDSSICLPKNGVYATITRLENGDIYPSVTNIGLRPTLNDGRGLSVETHILGISSDLYGQRVKVEFLSYLRPEFKFPSFEELSKQIKSDGEKAKELFLKEYSEGKI